MRIVPTAIQSVQLSVECDKNRFIRQDSDD